MAKKMLSPKQAKVYVDIRNTFGVSPNKAYNWVNKRVSKGGNVKKKKGFFDYD